MRIFSRLNRLEKDVERIKYKFCYRSVAIKDNDGDVWLTTNKGQKIKQKEADPNLVPPFIVVLPGKI